MPSGRLLGCWAKLTKCQGCLRVTGCFIYPLSLSYLRARSVAKASDRKSDRKNAFLPNLARVCGMAVCNGGFKPKGMFGCNMEASDSVHNLSIRSDFVCTALGAVRL